jgi:hypothetical protein
VYYSLDPSLNNIPQGTGAGAGTAPVTQITNAIATWNANNGIGITFSPASAGHAATYSISAQMTKVDYTGNTGTTYAQPGVIPVGANSNTYLYPNQRFHDGSPTFSSSAIGYATAYQEIMLHEIGHLLGLNDLNNDKTSGTALSVMEQGAGTNLAQLQLPLTPTQCDINEVKAASTRTPPTSGGGGDTPGEGTNVCVGSAPICSGGLPASCNAGNWSCPSGQCAGSPGTCPNGYLQECDGGLWSCPTVSTSECLGAPPCAGAECINGLWSSSTCVCSPSGGPPYIPPDSGAEYVWNSSTCSWVLEPCSEAGCSSPIIIDTAGTGFDLTSAKNGVSFDFFGTGHPIQIAWTATNSRNGWLALDRNNNGVIDSARELFGNITAQPPSNTPNGFLALAVFDKPANGGNDDGVIDEQDTIWAQLLVWIDSNHDGISQPDELFSMEEVGIRRIMLGYTHTPYVDENGNRFRYKGKLKGAPEDPTARAIYDVFLKSVPPASAPPLTIEEGK